jgi:hypothetical protein
MLSSLYPHPRDLRIAFDEEPHEYSIDGKKDPRIISVTTLVHSLFQPFNEDAIIRKMMGGRNWTSSKYYGMTAQQIKDLWEKNRVEASTAGTRMHKSIENYYNSLPNTEDDTAHIEYKYFQNFHAAFGFKAFRTEWFVFDEDIWLAGSIDMVYFRTEGDHTNLFIYDWKRCKEIKKENPFQTGKPPVDHLPDTNYWHYALQLNIYKRILESKYDKKIHELALIVLHPDNTNFIRIMLPILDDEVDAIWVMRRAILEGKPVTDDHDEPPAKPAGKCLIMDD